MLHNSTKALHNLRMAISAISGGTKKKNPGHLMTGTL